MPLIPSPADGVMLRYDIARHDDPARGTVVLLHGSVLSRAIWRGLGYLAPLAQEHTVVRLDLRGHGMSGAPHEAAAYAPERFVADVLAVLDAEDVDEAALVGYSLGARVALGTALAHPRRVSRLVSLGGSASAQRGAVDSVFFPGVIDVLREKGMEEFCARQGFGPEATSRLAASTRSAFLAADPLAMAALFTATDETPAVDAELLEASTVPALWMAGTEDHPRLEESQEAARIMPRGSFVPLPGRTHGATLAPPVPVLEEILPFLR